MSDGLKLKDLSRQGIAPTNLEIAAGEIVAVMGPSGAGKSLLMRAIADLDPHDGDASIKGELCSAMPAPAWRRRVAYLPAESGWWAERVREHFRDADTALPRLKLLSFPGDVLDWSVSRLSTGEPTAALDDRTEQAVESLLRELASNGTAILLVTHDKAQAKRLAQKRFTMEAGKLTAEAAP